MARRSLNRLGARILDERDDDMTPEEQAARIAELEAQVAALREIARGERAGFLHYRASCYDPGRRCPYAKGCDDCTGWDTCSALDRFNADAIRQLHEEHPEAFR